MVLCIMRVCTVKAIQHTCIHLVFSPSSFTGMNLRGLCREWFRHPPFRPPQLPVFAASNAGTEAPCWPWVPRAATSETVRFGTRANDWYCWKIQHLQLQVFTWAVFMFFVIITLFVKQQFKKNVKNPSHYPVRDLSLEWHSSSAQMDCCITLTQNIHEKQMSLARNVPRFQGLSNNQSAHVLWARIHVKNLKSGFFNRYGSNLLGGGDNGFIPIRRISVWSILRSLSYFSPNHFRNVASLIVRWPTNDIFSSRFGRCCAKHEQVPPGTCQRQGQSTSLNFGNEPAVRKTCALRRSPGSKVQRQSCNKNSYGVHRIGSTILVYWFLVIGVWIYIYFFVVAAYFSLILLS